MFKKEEEEKFTEEPNIHPEEINKCAQFECVSKELLLKDHFLMNNPLFKIKMTELLTNFTKYRLIKRDGNCFYTSFLVNYLKNEEILEKKEFFLEINQKYSTMTKTTVVDEFYESFIFLKESLSARDLSEVSIYEFLSSVTYLKVLIHYELICNEDFYQNFIEVPLSDFINSKVNPLYIEAEDIHIQALAKLLEVKVNVFSVRNDNQGEKSEFGDGKLEINILNTPNHFEPIIE
ncbi:cysteine protease [Tubulinosema ratisbonensis]|uniref:ubiquitinyl hydrolase 1 n=1 Tax=Tubulinosema ratisbonensis TaxID=291195 RepID=A0A437AKM1_9MICR|nr:cysteine protease [Tubulinosema ratisbonensis]